MIAKTDFCEEVVQQDVLRRRRAGGAKGEHPKLGGRGIYAKPPRRELESDRFGQTFQSEQLFSSIWARITAIQTKMESIAPVCGSLVWTTRAK